MNENRRFNATSVLLVGMALLLAGCSTNPVTGKTEMQLVSDSMERSIGGKNYAPYRQAQGGDYQVDPVLSRYVQSVGDRLARVSDRKLPYEFKIVNDSTPNAWALPGGKIAVHRGLLLELQSEAELAAVLSHEIVHAAARHSAQSMERGIFIQGAVLAAGVALSDSDYQGMGMAGAGVASSLLKTRYGRDAEREADHYGIRYMVRAGYDPQAAVSLQETFVRLAKGEQSGWLKGLFASHPPSQERVDNNRRLVAGMQSRGGEIGRKRYQQKIARLKRAKPAYEAYDKGLVALKKKQLGKALKLANLAVKTEPDEALFYELRADVRERQGRKRAALKDYDRALTHNPGYFRPQLKRGLLRQRLGDRDGAERDLQQSIQILPTAEAYYGLGLVAENAGRQNLAISHFRKASQVKSSAGKQAGIALARLDLASNPGRYLNALVGRDKKGNLAVQITNNAPVAVRQIRVVIGVRAGNGIREEESYWLRRQLESGKRVQIATDIGPVSGKQVRRYAAIVTDARLAE